MSYNLSTYDKFPSIDRNCSAELFDPVTLIFFSKNVNQFFIGKREEVMLAVSE